MFCVRGSRARSRPRRCANKCTTTRRASSLNDNLTLSLNDCLAFPYQCHCSFTLLHLSQHYTPPATIILHRVSNTHNILDRCWWEQRTEKLCLTIKNQRRLYENALPIYISTIVRGQHKERSSDWKAIFQSMNYNKGKYHEKMLFLTLTSIDMINVRKLLL